MSDRRFYDPQGTPLTLEEHRALDLDRPYTDQAIGAYTDGKRSHAAFCSSLFDDPSLIHAHDRKKPGNRAVCPVGESKPPEHTPVPPETQNRK